MKIKQFILTAIFIIFSFINANYYKDIKINIFNGISFMQKLEIEELEGNEYYSVNKDSLLEINYFGKINHLKIKKIIVDVNNKKYLIIDENNNNITQNFEILNDTIYLKELVSKFNNMKNHIDSEIYIIVSIKFQRLYVINKNGDIERVYAISSSKYGIGNKTNSFQTPLGLHIIAEKRGANAPIGAYFKNRKIQGIVKIFYDDTDNEDDYITTRIMHLKGIEKGVNEGKGISSYERQIYIHGTQEEGLIGKPASHGCIRMKNKDIVELFDMIEINNPVYIIK